MAATRSAEDFRLSRSANLKPRAKASSEGNSPHHQRGSHKERSGGGAAGRRPARRIVVAAVEEQIAHAVAKPAPPILICMFDEGTSCCRRRADRPRCAETCAGYLRRIFVGTSSLQSKSRPPTLCRNLPRRFDLGQVLFARARTPAARTTRARKGLFHATVDAGRRAGGSWVRIRGGVERGTIFAVGTRK